MAKILSLLSEIDRQRAQEIRSSLDQHLSSCVGIKRGKECYVLVNLIDNWHVVVGVRVVGILGLRTCSVLLADEMHELLLLEVLGKAVEGFLVDACVSQEGLRKAEDA